MVDDKGIPSPDADTDKDDPEEIEIVHTGDAGSQPGQDNLGIRRRIRGLKAERNASENRATQSNAQVEHLQEEVRLLKLGNQHQTEPPALPDPNKYEDGQSDPK